MGLFNCYVREYSFVKQQLVGLSAGEQFISLYFPFLMSCSVTDSHKNVQTCRRRKVLAVGSLQHPVTGAATVYPAIVQPFGTLFLSCEDLVQVLCDKSGEKLLLLAEGLLKKHIASHSMHEPEGEFTLP